LALLGVVVITIWLLFPYNKQKQDVKEDQQLISLFRRAMENASIPGRRE
jgi:hypothetical protein